MSIKKGFIAVADDLSAQTSDEIKRSSALKAVSTALSSRLSLPIHVIHAEDLGPIGPAHEMFAVEIGRLLEGRKSHWSESYRNAHGRQKLVIIEGRPADSILKFTARAPKPAMLIMGTHGRTGFKRALLGSVAEEVIRNSKIPVMTLGPTFLERGLNTWESASEIVFGLDTGPNSEKAMKFCVQLSRSLKASVKIVHCLQEGLHPVVKTAIASPNNQKRAQDLLLSLRKGAEKQLRRAQAAFKKAKVRAEVVLDTHSDHADAAVINQIGGQTLAVVVGTHGRNRLAQAFVGTTARRLIQNAPVPVITVRSLK